MTLNTRQSLNPEFGIKPNFLSYQLFQFFLFLFFFLFHILTSFSLCFFHLLLFGAALHIYLGLFLFLTALPPSCAEPVRTIFLHFFLPRSLLPPSNHRWGACGVIGVSVGGRLEVDGELTMLEVSSAETCCTVNHLPLLFLELFW